MSQDLVISKNLQHISSGIRISSTNENQQVQLEISNDKVIFIANVKRNIDNVIDIGPLFHQAILVVTSNKPEASIDNDLKYHIVEYMKFGQGEVCCYQININMRNNPRYLEDLKEFQDEQFNWKVMENSWGESLRKKKKFYINGYLQVKNIKDLMKIYADYKGSYDLVNNNCQTVANQTTQLLLNLTNKNQRGIFDFFIRFFNIAINTIIDFFMKIPQLLKEAIKLGYEWLIEKVMHLLFSNY